MSLQKKLDAYNQQSAGKFTEEQQTHMAAFKKNLADEKRKMPVKGDTLPAFSLQDQNGVQLSSTSLLQHKKKLVAVFFRGSW